MRSPFALGSRVKRVRPLHFTHEDGLPAWQTAAVLIGTRNTLEAAGVSATIDICNLGAWRGENWKERGRLTAWNSIDWYIEHTQLYSRTDQLNVSKFIELLRAEPWQHKQPHYDVILTKRDLYDRDCEFCVGGGAVHFGTILSTYRFKGVPENIQYACLATAAMHKLGRMFGLVPHGAKEYTKDSPRTHDHVRCIMQQNIVTSQDWIRITEERIAGGGFCPTCTQSLKQYFIH